MGNIPKKISLQRGIVLFSSQSQIVLSMVIWFGCLEWWSQCGLKESCLLGFYYKVKNREKGCEHNISLEDRLSLAVYTVHQAVGRSLRPKLF